MSLNKNVFMRLGSSGILIGISLLVSLLLAEALMRAFPSLLSGETLLRIHWQTAIEQRTKTIEDPFIGFRYRANSRESVNVGEVAFSFLTDEHGFRNASPWPDEAEIVTVGDSLTFGYGVPDGQEWPSLVAKKLTPNRLVNLALSGMAPQQYHRVLESLGVALRPKLVILGLFPGNDLDDARVFNAWIEAGSPGDYNVWRFFGGDVPNSDSTLRSLFYRSYLLAFVREVKNKAGGFGGGEVAPCADGRVLRLAPGIRHSGVEDDGVGDPDFGLVIQSLQHTRELAEKNGAHLLVLLIPTKERVYLTPTSESSDLMALFGTALSERAIEYLDATSIFEQKAQQGGCPFFEIDGHPNAEGYAMIASLVIEYLGRQRSRFGLRDW